ncbi:MAG TPA: ATP-binding protein [Candidatus Methylomirabilis sp.]|nr:ATP-binding protein [Candidatus Methylomirabilis sp.]
MKVSKVELPELLGKVNHYLLALVVLAVWTVILWLFRGVLSTQIIALMYLLPVILTATLWGLGPGILISLAAFLTYNYLFIPPFNTFTVLLPEDLLALCVFLIVAVVISQLLGMARAGVLAATSREREATQLYELSIALSGLQEIPSIAQTLGQKILETFSADAVEVTLSPAEPDRAYSCLLPEGAPRPSGSPTGSFPMATARGTQGKVSLWRKSPPLSAQEQRMLRTYTSQGALAVEHSLLAEASNRAKVLEESDRMKTSLLSSVSHELRTPLATIKAAVSSLRTDEGDLDEASRAELLAAIEEESDHLNLLVGNLLNSTRIELGALNPQRKWNSLGEIVSGALKRMHQVTANHRIVVDIPADFPLIPVDYFQIEQVFTNLISNSVKYAPVGTQVRIEASVREMEGAALVRVSNQGPPVPEADLGRIFDMFYRITAADRVPGTGLGLSICKGIVEAHGGKIWAANEPGRFVFNFTLPMTIEGAEPVLPEETKSQ